MGQGGKGLQGQAGVKTVRPKSRERKTSFEKGGGRGLFFGPFAEIPPTPLSKGGNII
jgi:hypothetical protein